MILLNLVALICSEHSRDETNLVQQWFDIVYERNVLMRYESELMVQ